MSWLRPLTPVGTASALRLAMSQVRDVSTSGATMRKMQKALLVGFEILVSTTHLCNH